MRRLELRQEISHRTAGRRTGAPRLTLDRSDQLRVAHFVDGVGETLADFGDES